MIRAVIKQSFAKRIPVINPYRLSIEPRHETRWSKVIPCRFKVNRDGINQYRPLGQISFGQKHTSNITQIIVRHFGTEKGDDNKETQTNKIETVNKKMVHQTLDDVASFAMGYLLMGGVTAFVMQYLTYDPQIIYASVVTWPIAWAYMTLYALVLFIDAAHIIVHKNDKKDK